MDAKRLAVGFGWGVMATIAMSALMILGVVTGLSPMPAPIPEAVVNKGLGLFGVGLPQPPTMLLAAVAHLSYGGVAGAILATLTRPVTVWKGLGWGVFLWLVMQVAVFPLLGWGFFGVAITLRIAVATLVLHLVYGATLGLLMDRGRK
ncbi:MAG: hypothetical protein M3P49_16345 [Actinomycetota bacterium]|nr:hypothetical protein [Actinomycetota bacterium]